MKFTRREWIATTIAAPLGAAPAAYTPGKEWDSTEPARAGCDPAALEDAAAFASANNSTALLLVRGGRLVMERYWSGWVRMSAQPIFSAGKSVCATLIGAAIEDGKLKGLDQPAADFVPEWKGTPKQAITLRHMLAMTSGVKVARDAPGPGEDQFATTAAQPLEHQPGQHWAYNTPVYRMLLRILEIATGEELNAYSRRRLTDRIGMENCSWDKQEKNWLWFRCTPRDMCRFGLLSQREGKWNGKQIVKAGWFREMMKPSQTLNPAYGLLWWLNGSATMIRANGKPASGPMFPAAPADTRAALGAMDKKIYVIPSLDLVVARHGPAAAAGPASFDNELLKRILKGVRS